VLFCGLQKGIRNFVAWSALACVGWPRGGGTFLVMPSDDVCQGYHMY
jgi:hypothetical protein